MFNIWRKNKLDNNGERVDIDYYHMNYNKFDIYQQSHYQRYIYAKNLINKTDICADLACGTGYGSMMLAEKCANVVGVDKNTNVINIISKKYNVRDNVIFLSNNLLNLNYQNEFDSIISFETIEHFKEVEIPTIFSIFSKAIKHNGLLIFSTPYNQGRTDVAIKMGFHLTFNIVEESIQKWLNGSGFILETIKYQNYQNHEISETLEIKDFMICTAKKI